MSLSSTARRERGPFSSMSKIGFGGDYNPDQWPEEVWLDDVRLMRAAGVNLVSVGIFSWAGLEPAPGEYDFGWLDRLLDLLNENGVSVNLATPTASPPPWLARMDPASLPVTADGVRLWHGSRRHYCPHNTTYRGRAAAIAREARRAVWRTPSRRAVARRQRIRVPRQRVLLRDIGRCLPAVVGGPLRHAGALE